jgi:hypothetical protein
VHTEARARRLPPDDPTSTQPCSCATRPDPALYDLRAQASQRQAIVPDATSHLVGATEVPDSVLPEYASLKPSVVSPFLNVVRAHDSWNESLATSRSHDRGQDVHHVKTPILETKLDE